MQLWKQVKVLMLTVIFYWEFSVLSQCFYVCKTQPSVYKMFIQSCQFGLVISCFFKNFFQTSIHSPADDVSNVEVPPYIATSYLLPDYTLQFWALITTLYLLFLNLLSISYSQKKNYIKAGILSVLFTVTYPSTQNSA